MGMKRTVARGALAMMLAMTSSIAARAADDAPAEPDGYWQGPMLSKVPATITGGRVVTTENLAELIKRDMPVLIDVIPAPRRPADPSMLWLPVPHRNIPRSVWMPGVGSAVISAAMTDYFRMRLDELTGHDRQKLIVFYCRPNCWASWNAAKRAIAEGYSRVGWYADGVEAWQAAGLPMQNAAAEGPGVQ